MPDDKARVRARGDARCPDFEAQKRGLRRFLGYELKEVTPGVYDFAKKSTADESLRSRELAHAIADGDLWAADKETAEWAESLTRKSVMFDPMFGAAAPAKSSATKEKV